MRIHLPIDIDPCGDSCSHPDGHRCHYCDGAICELFRTVLPARETRGPECLVYTAQHQQDQLVQACRIPVIRDVIEKALEVVRSSNEDDHAPGELREALEALRGPLGLQDIDFEYIYDPCRGCQKSFTHW